MHNKLALIHENAGEASELLKVMAHKDRMVVLCLLSAGEMGVAELREHTKLSQSAFSQHLTVLRKNKLVSIRKEAQAVFYSLADERVNILLKAMQQAFCPTLVSEE
ncbi:metalloregulator ArsR/SmtB family transcription factor [Psychromonas sp. 14N.309.X.WAT.B.A12]|uniref:ArsR/SmtB family transcription factor n=1 Tax=Psychromonas sp. 14N.309.X.WAT.B.A12 TaxID=2998322 RepID=UPI0025B1964B|nr:metalloregulator ArsR/SmtB family transcription factor [Psychromonas sp. 14N.309.X.WAT.B.A12]MDN2663578.1 metalloregulator ArsR/SmtB family transcription factor [Psychromonas sp. 14N.309.X.WAT.B.A12]